MKRAVMIAVVLALAMGGNVLVASAAQAGPDRLDCANAVDVGLTIRDGAFVKGSGSWTKCTSDVNRVEIILYKEVGIGYASQHILNFDPADFGSHAYTVLKGCIGTSTKRWYTTVQAWSAAGNLVTNKKSNTLTTTC